MSIGGNPKRCPKPCPSVNFNDKPSVYLYSETDEIIPCKEKIQLVKSKENAKVESKDLIESDIDLVEIFKTIYEENEDSFDQKMEGIDQIQTSLFSDKVFLNEDWHKHTCTESCAAIGNARHGSESLGTDIQSIREIDDSGCTVLSENGNMLANMTGSSILESTDHTNQVKPGNLSDRFILSDGESYSDDFSKSESEIFESDSDDDWESCVSSVEEDECFYDAVSLDNSQDMSYYSFPTRSLNLETNLSGLAMDCKQVLKFDQVPELNESYLIENKKQLNNDDSSLEMLSNMMEKETHVGSVSSDEQTDIGQILNDIVKDQSEVYRRAEEAISGLSQSNQCRLGKSDGKPGTPLPATKSDRQSQKVGLGNLSLNSPNIISPNIIAGNMFQDLDGNSKYEPLDEFGIWSNFVDILDFVKAGLDSSITYTYDLKRHQNSKIKYFDAAFSNVPNIENILTDQNYNSKKENFDAANCNKPNVSAFSQTPARITQKCLFSVCE